MARKLTDRRCKHDWPLLRRSYVEGVPLPDGTTDWPTLESLWTRYKVNRSTMVMRASAEKWTEKRAEYQARVDKELREKKIAAIVAEQTEFDSQCLRVAKAAITLIVKRMAEINPQQPQDAKAKPKKSMLIGGEIGRLTRALRDAQDAGHTAMGIGKPTVESSKLPPAGSTGVMRFEWVKGEDPTAVDYD